MIFLVWGNVNTSWFHCFHPKNLISPYIFWDRRLVLLNFVERTLKALIYLPQCEIICNTPCALQKHFYIESLFNLHLITCLPTVARLVAPSSGGWAGCQSQSPRRWWKGTLPPRRAPHRGACACHGLPSRGTYMAHWLLCLQGLLPCICILNSADHCVRFLPFCDPCWHVRLHGSVL